MFEVGKKLIDKDKERIVEILFVTDKNIMVRYIYNSTKEYTGREFCWERSAIETAGWKEYHEPVVMKTKRSVIKGRNGLYTSDYDHENEKVVGYIELTVTDGKLTDVRIV